MSGRLPRVGRLSARDTLIAEVGAAVGLVGLLLVFLPIFLDAVRTGRGGAMPWRKLQLLKLQSWLVAGTVGVGAADATLGLLTLWGTSDFATPTAVLLVIAVWAVVLLAILATWQIG
jgi:hypothetical protein